MTHVEISRARPRPCHRCGDLLLISAQVPHSWTRTEGTTVEGLRTVGLCPSCDRGDPDAQGVLAFFALNPTITDDTVSSAAALIEEWAHRVAQRPPPEIPDAVDDG